MVEAGHPARVVAPLGRPWWPGSDWKGESCTRRVLASSLHWALTHWCEELLGWRCREPMQGWAQFT